MFRFLILKKRVYFFHLLIREDTVCTLVKNYDEKFNKKWNENHIFRFLVSIRKSNIWQGAYFFSFFEFLGSMLSRFEPSLKWNPVSYSVLVHYWYYRKAFNFHMISMHRSTFIKMKLWFIHNFILRSYNEYQFILGLL